MFHTSLASFMFQLSSVTWLYVLMIVAPFTVTAYPAGEAINQPQPRRGFGLMTQQGARGWTLYARLHGQG